MNIIRIAFYNLKRYIKSPLLLTTCLFIPIAFMITTLIEIDITNSNTNVALVNLNTVQVKELISNAPDVYVSFKEETLDNGLSLLEKSEISAVYEFPINFFEDLNSGKEPKIKVYKKKDSKPLQRLEGYIDIYVKRKLKDFAVDSNTIKNSEVKYTFINNSLNFSELSIFVLFAFFMFCSIAYTAIDLFKLRRDNVLTRLLYSTSKHYEIFTGLLLSIFLLQLFSLTLTLFIGKVTNLLESNILKPYIYLILIAFITTALTVLIIRLFDNEGIISIVIVLAGTLFLMGALLAPINFPGKPDFLPESFLFICKFSPLYWVMDGIVDDILFPNTLILLLMGIAILTAGKLNFKSLQKKEE